MFLKSLVMAVCLLSASFAEAGDKHEFAGLTNLSQSSLSLAKVVELYFPDKPIMVYVANCESELVHSEGDGLLLSKVGQKKSAGVLQIHLGLHEKAMQARGLNPNVLRDYMQYARSLFDSSGLAPWKDSKHCWQQYAGKV